MDYQCDVLFVGGGLAGINAARTIETQNRAGGSRPVSYTLLEATDRIGGRVKSRIITGENQPAIKIEQGAQWLHADVRPGTGWAPQVWKQFDADATRQDFVRMKELGVNCVRVFLSYGSFLMETNRLMAEGLAKFDQFLEIAEQAGIYVGIPARLKE
jgi:hypothetical protein